MDIICLQTADPFDYYEMLSETSKTVRLYCKDNGIHYHCYIGVKRGYFSWHANFNRIYMVKEVLDSGFRGWIYTSMPTPILQISNLTSRASSKINMDLR